MVDKGGKKSYNVSERLHNKHYLLPLPTLRRIFNMATIRKLKSGNYQAIITVDGRKISATGKTEDEALKAVFNLGV